MSEKTILQSDNTGAQESTAEFNFREHLSEGNKEKFPEFKDMDSVFKGYDNLVSKMGQNPIVKPKDDASDEVKAEYFSSLRKELGAPDSKDAYKIEPIEGAPDGFINEELLDNVNDVFLKHGVPADAAKEIVNTYFTKQLEAHNGLQNEAAQAQEASIQALKDDWKGEYEGNINKAKAFAEKNYSTETIEKYGNDPLFIKDTLSLFNKTSGDRLEDLSGQVRQTSGDLRMEAISLQKSDDFKNTTSPSHNTVKTRVSDLYRQIAEMGA